MRNAVIERVTALVTPDPNVDHELAQAERRAAAGDASWAEWLEDVAAGRALIAHLELEVTLLVGDALERYTVHAPGVWLELDPHPPLVECQVQDAAGVALGALEGQLPESGEVDVPTNRLPSMCVHVELDDAVRERLPTPTPHP